MNLSESTRAYIYRIEVAVVPVLIAHGIVNESTAALWVSLIGAVFGLGLAVRNTSTKPES
jgi:hypothetical protein